jgi:hypothetical protein
MTTEILGKLSFAQTPDVNGDEVMLNAGGVPQILSGTTAARPSAILVGQLYLDTTLNKWYRDNGSSWDDLTPVPLINGTSNQVLVTPGTNVTPAIVALANDVILPGTAGFRPPVGTTAQRLVLPSAGDTRFNSSLTRMEEFNGSIWKPQGIVLQVVAGSIAAASGTALIPLDNTLPLNTEGWQIWTNTFTPLSATSKVLIQFSVTVSNSASTATNICSVFAGSTNLAVTATRSGIANAGDQLVMNLVFQPGSTAAVVLSARLGGSAAGTSYCNQIGTTTLGGGLVTEYIITEIQ